MRNDDKYLVVSDLGGGTASAAKNRSDKYPDRKYAELTAKLKEAQKLISEQKKLIDKQNRYIPEIHNYIKTTI